MKRETDLKALYFGTPVVLISSLNADGTTNLAPMSSAWWLGRTAVLGMGAASQTVRNLRERSDCVLNLVDASMVAAVDRLALLSAGSRCPSHASEASSTCCSRSASCPRHGTAGTTCSTRSRCGSPGRRAPERGTHPTWLQCLR